MQTAYTTAGGPLCGSSWIEKTLAQEDVRSRRRRPLGLPETCVRVMRRRKMVGPFAAAAIASIVLRWIASDRG